MAGAYPRVPAANPRGGSLRGGVAGFRGGSSGYARQVGSPAQVDGAPAAAHNRPGLLFFYSRTSGRCRRAEAYLAQVLQRRHNHETFHLYGIPVDQRPDLAERFHIDVVPSILVVDGHRVRLRIVAPAGAREIARRLSPWLR
jgi:hypothetical protein